MSIKINDCIIIGAGPAGLTAAIYLKRANIDVLVVEKGPYGGKVNFTAIVNNYLGIENISGPDLAMKFYAHAIDNDVKIISDDVLSVNKENEIFNIKTESESYYAKTIIVASGTQEKKLEIENSMKFEHKGISYCAICDGPLYKNQNVAVIGGGNSAIEEAIYLSSIAKKVYLIHRRAEFRADEKLVNELKNKSNVQFLLNTTVKSLIGEKKLEKILLSDNKTIEVSAIFPYLGQIPNVQFLNLPNILTDQGYIIVDSNMETTIKGLYAAGDVTNYSLKQIATAVGQGATAAQSVIRLIK